MYIYRDKLQFGQWADGEGITVIFPSEFRLGDPVYTCWQWTVNPVGGEKNVSVFRTGAIDEVTVSQTGLKIGFYYGDDYSFDAIFTGDVDKASIDKLSVTMRASSGDVSEQADLPLVYKSNQDVSPDPTVPRMYLGKMNYGRYAVDETLLIVAPGSMDKGNTICAFWRWTELHSGPKKVIVSVVSTIEYVKELVGIGESFEFENQSGYYKFYATVDETSKKLHLTMKGGSGGETKEQILDLQDLDTPSTRERRKIINHTTEVFNDTSEIVICSLKASGTGLTDKLLSTASLVPGGVGLLTALPFGFPPPVDAYAAAVGWHVAVAGTGQVFNRSGEDTSTALFPLDSMKRTSSSIAITTNDLHINLVRVDNSNHRLVVSTATVKELGALTQNLSKLLPGEKLAPEYKQLLAVDLRPDMRILAYRNVVIPQLSVNAKYKAKDVNTMKGNDIPNALATFDKSTSTLNWYGTLDEYYDRATPAEDSTLFSYSHNVGLTFSQGVNGSGGSHASVLTVEKDDGSREFTLLKFTNCAMGDMYHTMRLLNPCQTEDEVKITIKENGSYWAYGWRGAGEPLIGYMPSETTSVVHAKEDYCVYFIAQSCNQMQSLAAM